MSETDSNMEDVLLLLKSQCEAVVVLVLLPCLEQPSKSGVSPGLRDGDDMSQASNHQINS